MFVSSYRPVVYPQFEHARLAGAIAQHWGNENFRCPDLPFDAFCTGVALHDHGYGLLDTHDILHMNSQERLQAFNALMQMHFDNSIAEIVAKMHVARLMNMAGLFDLEASFRQELQEQIASTGISEDVFRDADTITRLCDSIAFDFCLERSTNGHVNVMAKRSCERVDVSYEIDFQGGTASKRAHCAGGCIYLAPWPLSCATVKGYLFSYAQSDYPKVLNPHRVEFEIHPG